MGVGEEQQRSLVWEDPPGGASTLWGKWEPTADELRAHPGQWARIAERPTPAVAGSLARQIRIGRLRGFQPAGAFEATTRGELVYARYVGEGDVT